MKIHFYDFYCMDNVPLELEDDNGVKLTVNSMWKDPDPMTKQRLIDEEIKLDIKYLEDTFPDAPDGWVVVVHWNTGYYFTHRGLGKVPKVLN